MAFTDPPMNQDEYQALLESQFETDPPEGDEGGPAESGGEPDPSAGAEGQAPATGRVKVGSGEYEQSEIEELLAFQAWARSNPDKMAAFAAYLQGEAEFIPQSQRKQDPPTPPKDEVDWDAIREESPQTAEALERIRREQAQHEQYLAALTQQQNNDRLRQVSEAAQSAVSAFKERMGLGDDEVERLVAETAQRGHLVGLKERIGDPAKAVETALEMTYWSDDSFRQAAIQREMESLKTHDERKRKAALVTAGSGSAERGVSLDLSKMSVQDKTRAMAAEIAEWQRGTQ